MCFGLPASIVQVPHLVALYNQYPRVCALPAYGYGSCNQLHLHWRAKRLKGGPVGTMSALRRTAQSTQHQSVREEQREHKMNTLNGPAHGAPIERFRMGGPA